MSVSYRQKSTMHTHGVSAKQCLSVQEPMQAVKSCFKKAVSLLYHGQKRFTCLHLGGGWCLRLPSPTPTPQNIDGEGTLRHKQPYSIYLLHVWFFFYWGRSNVTRTFKIFKHFFNNHTWVHTYAKSNAWLKIRRIQMNAYIEFASIINE